MRNPERSRDEALRVVGSPPRPICSPQFVTLKPDFECRRDVKRHLLQDRVVASEGRIDHGEIPLVREIEEVHLYFPTRLPIEDFCVPGYLGRDLQGTA